MGNGYVPAAQRLGPAGMTLVVPEVHHALARSAEVGALLRNLSADDECAHGRLAGDRTPACGCWPSEATS